MGVDEAQLTRYGEIVARLARPLSDRSAVLWAVRLDAASFGALEAACVAAMSQNPQAGAAFARAYARALALLSHEPSAATAPPVTRAEPAMAPEVTAEMKTQALPPEVRTRRPAKTVELDMFTLASATQATSPRPIESTEPDTAQPGPAESAVPGSNTDPSR